MVWRGGDNTFVYLLLWPNSIEIRRNLEFLFFFCIYYLFIYNTLLDIIDILHHLPQLLLYVDYLELLSQDLHVTLFIAIPLLHYGFKQ